MQTLATVAGEWVGLVRWRSWRVRRDDEMVTALGKGFAAPREQMTDEALPGVDGQKFDDFSPEQPLVISSQSRNNKSHWCKVPR